MPAASAGKEGVTTAPCFVQAIPSVEVAYAMLDAPPPQQAPYQILYSPPSKRTLPGTTPDASTSPPVPRGSTTPWRDGKTGGSVTAPRTYRIPEEAPTFEASAKSSRKSTASPRASVGNTTTHTTARTIPSPTRPFTRAEWEGGRKSLRSRHPMGTDVGAEASGDTCAAPTLNGGGDTRAVFRPWRSFPTMVLAGLIVGVALGDRLVFATQIATVALIVAMTLALTEIRFQGLSMGSEARAFAPAVFWNYVVLTGIILGFAAFTTEPDLRNGWVVMAAVPSAIAVVPLASIVKGNVRSVLVSSALLYLLALVLVPAITLSFAGRAVPPADVAVQTFLQIGVPLLASRVLVRIPAIQTVRRVGVNVSFFVLMTMVVGGNRIAFADPGLVLSLVGAALLRTFGIGLGALGLARLARRPREDRVAWTLFGSFKNGGLTALLALFLFGAKAAIPAIVCLLFEILWLSAIPVIFRDRPAV